LRLMRENSEVTVEQLAKLTDISTKGIERQIKKLKTEKLIRRIAPAKGGRWEVAGYWKGQAEK